MPRPKPLNMSSKPRHTNQLVIDSRDNNALGITGVSHLNAQNAKDTTDAANILPHTPAQTKNLL